MNQAGDALGDSDECLLRQVNPSWIHGGRVSSQAFCPTQKDSAKLSVARASISTPRESFERFVENGWTSVGVWAVTVGEVGGVGLKSYPDPDPDGWSNPAHAFIHFSDLPKGKTKKKAQVLAAHAHDRGCVYRPDSDGSAE